MFSYGSGVVTDGTGIVMNNNLGNFTLRPDIADATARPRMHHQWYPDRLEVESGFNPDVIRALRARGHDVQFSAGMRSLRTVMFLRWALYGYGDPRRPGAMALGY